MADPNRAVFESVVRLLAPVLDDLVFVGGCTTGLFITDPAAAGIRPTVDVDAIVDVASFAGYTTLADRLRALGLGEDTSPGALMCRWRRDGVVADVLPVDERILGFSNRWYPTALVMARTLDLVQHRVRVVTPPLFVATKLEAFRGRGRGDFLGSHDLEDIVTVFDGRAELPGEIADAPADVRDYIAAEWERCSAIATSSTPSVAFCHRTPRVNAAEGRSKRACAAPLLAEVPFGERATGTGLEVALESPRSRRVCKLQRDDN